MASAAELSLSEKRNMLRQQIHQQRELIARELIHTTEVNNTYPRSITMRFLTQQSGAKIVAEVATLFIGARLFKSLGKAFTFAKIIKTMASKPKN
ncbi:MAG: hypothetical protein V4732_12975 [Pseudomonadota bacterium]